MKRKRIYQTYEVSVTASDMISRVGRLLRFKAGVYLKQSGADVTPEQWGLLLKIAEREGLAQIELADPVLNDHPNITRMLDGLERRGLIKRVPAPNDRRSSLVYLEKEGKDLIDRILPGMVDEKGEFFRGFNEKDIDKLRILLGIIEQNIIGA